MYENPFIGEYANLLRLWSNPRMRFLDHLPNIRAGVHFLIDHRVAIVKDDNSSIIGVHGISVDILLNGQSEHLPKTLYCVRGCFRYKHSRLAENCFSNRFIFTCDKFITDLSTVKIISGMWSRVLDQSSIPIGPGILVCCVDPGYNGDLQPVICSSCKSQLPNASRSFFCDACSEKAKHNILNKQDKVKPDRVCAQVPDKCPARRALAKESSYTSDLAQCLAKEYVAKYRRIPTGSEMDHYLDGQPLAFRRLCIHAFDEIRRNHNPMVAPQQQWSRELLVSGKVLMLDRIGERSNLALPIPARQAEPLCEYVEIDEIQDLMQAICEGRVMKRKEELLLRNKWRLGL